MKRTKIIATVWPATNSEEKLLALYKAWVNVIRFNFSHANYEDSWKTAQIIHTLNKSNKTKLSLLLDTKWPEIRTWDLKDNIEFKQGDVFNIYTDSTEITWNNLFCDYPYLSEDIDDNWTICIDSGLLNVKVIKKCNWYVKVEALNFAVIWSRRHVNLPGVRLRLPWITEKDTQDILWWIKNGFSIIAASFIRNAQNIKDIRSLLDANWWSHIEINSKVENAEAIENIDEIVAESDWVMVARWDLWIEVPIQKLALYQKMIVEKCQQQWKWSIIATHLLETMTDNPFPTRAESSDVFNAVLQKPDCLMLSWESAIWAFPIESVKIMSSIIEEAEKHAEYDYKDYNSSNLSERDVEKKLLIRSGIFIWEDLSAKALLVFTKSGKLAKLASLFRPKIRTFAFTPNSESVGICNQRFAISTILLKSWDEESHDSTLEWAIAILLKSKDITPTDTIIAISDIEKNWSEIPIMKIINVWDFAS